MGNKSFTSDVLTLTSVPVISQILGILLTPIVTRLYAPEAFGLFNVLGSALMLFAVFSTMGYHGAIFLPKNRDFRTITDEELIHAMKRLNNRPGKRLGFKTPNQEFFGEISIVALTT